MATRTRFFPTRVQQLRDRQEQTLTPLIKARTAPTAQRGATGLLTRLRGRVPTEEPPLPETEEEREAQLAAAEVKYSERLQKTTSTRNWRNYSSSIKRKIRSQLAMACFPSWSEQYKQAADEYKLYESGAKGAMAAKKAAKAGKEKAVPVYEVPTNRGTIQIAASGQQGAISEAYRQLGADKLTGKATKVGEVKVIGYTPSQSKEIRKSITKGIREGTISLGEVTEPTVVRATQEQRDTEAQKDCPGMFKFYAVKTDQGIIHIESTKARRTGAERRDKDAPKYAAEIAEDRGYKVYSVSSAGMKKPVGRATISWSSKEGVAQPGATQILTDREIPRELRMAKPEVQEATGVKKVKGVWTQEVVFLGDGQYIPKKVLETFPPNYRTIAIKSGCQAMLDKYYVKIEDSPTGQPLYITKDAAERLKDTTTYKQARGTEAEKLSIALNATQRDFERQLKRTFPDLYTIYKEKGIEAYNQAFNKWQQNYISTLKEENPELYDAYKEGGWVALAESIGEQNEAYTEFQSKVKSGEIIALPDGEYITKEEFDKCTQGEQQILKEGGFAALGTATALMYEKKGKSSEAFPRYITREQYQSLNVIDRAMYSPAPGYGPRAAIELATPFVPPIKAILPEYTIADVSTTDWLLAGANVALIPVAFGPGAATGAAATAGRMATIGRGVGIAASGIISGVVAYETAQNWDELTPAQRGLGVGIAALCSIPVLTTVGRNVKIAASPAIPTTKGNVVAWKGLSVAGHPIIGRSGGKWILGTRSLTIPEARLILDGYHPQMMLETKVFVNQSTLAKAGFTKAQVDYLIKTLKARNLFAGKLSPWLDKNVLIEPTERLTANEIKIVLQRVVQKPGQVKNAKLLYGSPTIKAQAAPELRNWRPLHDWDISVSGSQANAEAFTHSLLDDLKAHGGGKYRISPKSPTLIEKQIKGKWTHIADIHAYDISSVDIPASALDTTGQYSYGRMVSEPAITIDYPGVGKLQIMRLSESGVRKADTILRVRQTPQGTAFRPPARGIAQPGVPKDAADFYVTLRTFKGEAMAEDWLKSWARAMGYTDDWLSNVMAKTRVGSKFRTMNWNEWVTTTLKKEMLNVSAQTPSDIIGYEFTPAKSAAVSAGASPSIVVHVPSSLGASVSPALGKIISQPIYPYKQAQSPSVQKIAASTYPSVSSKIPSKYPFISKRSPMPSIPTSKFVLSPSLSISAVPSLSKAPSPYPYPSGYPYPSPSGKLIPTPWPSPAPSPVPSPTPSPVLKPSPKPKVKMEPVKLGRKRIPKPGQALQTWKQGVYWISVFEPFRTKGTKPDVVFSRHKPPWAKVARGRHSPQRTLKSIGKVPKLVELPMGVVTARVRNGRRISFSRN